MFYTKKFKTINELKKEIKEYIKYYNNDRIRLNLKKKEFGTVPNSFLSKYYLICLIFWVQCYKSRFLYFKTENLMSSF